MSAGYERGQAMGRSIPFGSSRFGRHAQLARRPLARSSTKRAAALGRTAPPRAAAASCSTALGKVKSPTARSASWTCSAPAWQEWSAQTTWPLEPSVLHVHTPTRRRARRAQRHNASWLDYLPTMHEGQETTGSWVVVRSRQLPAAGELHWFPSAVAHTRARRGTRRSHRATEPHLVARAHGSLPHGAVSSGARGS